MSLTATELAAIERLARWIVRRGLVTPALLTLEALRPLNRVGAVAMTFLNPLAGVCFSPADWFALRDALERRESVALLIELIEDIDAEQGHGTGEHGDG